MQESTYEAVQAPRRRATELTMAMHLFRVKSVEQSIADTDEPEHKLKLKLKKDLSVFDLVVFGVGVIIGIGIGILVLTGKQAALNAGPGIIGWDLALELALGAAVVSRGWSAYFQHLLDLPTSPTDRCYVTSPGRIT